MKRRTLIAATAATLAAPMVRAQSLPKGPVRIIVGFPPGGGTDALARVVAQKLQTMWGLSIVIENKAGAAGVIAADFVSKQAPDGNTLLMAHINSHALAPALGTRLNYDAERDFAPISMVGVTPNILICNADQPAKTVTDLVELCKRQPGKISFASAGGGSAQHFALEMFKLQAGIDALHVPSATPHIKSGKAIALAQTRLKRAKGFPGVPTMAESGFAGFEATVWYGLMAPARMPVGMTQRMNEDVNKVLAMPDVQEKMDQYGAEDGGGSIEKFASFIKNEQQKWAQVAKAANVKIDN
jgi:tripartite-type tricarboxylate transporter receptor subunit TctC